MSLKAPKLCLQSFQGAGSVLLHCVGTCTKTTTLQMIFGGACSLSHTHTHTHTHTRSLSLSLSLSLSVCLRLCLCLCLPYALSLFLSRALSLFMRCHETSELLSKKT